MTLLETVEMIKEYKKEQPGGILSIYLDTDRSKHEQQKEQWKISLKNGLKQLKSNLQPGLLGTEVKNMNQLIVKIEREIQLSKRQFGKSMVMFVSHDYEINETLHLQVPVYNQFTWQTTANLNQLDTIIENYPSTGIIVVQHDLCRLLDFAFGQVLEERQYICKVDTTDWRRFEGPAVGSMSHISSSSQKDRYQIRKAANSVREYKQLVPIMQQESLSRGWEGVFLLGEKEMIDILKPAFKNLSFTNIIYKNMINEGPQTILDSCYTYFLETNLKHIH